MTVAVIQPPVVSEMLLQYLLSLWGVLLHRFRDWAGDCGLLRLRMGHSRVWVVACVPLLREWWAAATFVPSMPCASNAISFRSILASSRLSFAWWFRRACTGLFLPCPLSACRRPLRLFTGRFLLTTVVSS